MDDLISRNAIEHLVMTKSYDLGEPIQKRLMMHDVESLPSAQPETFEWCHDCNEYDQEQHCCHRWSQQIRQTVSELEADYPQAMKDELEYWKKRAEEAEADYIRITGVRKYVPNIDLEEVEEDV